MKHLLVHCLLYTSSPGLTTAPAVAVDMAELAVDMLGKTETVEKNNNYNPIRKGVPVYNGPTQKDNDKQLGDLLQQDQTQHFSSTSFRRPR